MAKHTDIPEFGPLSGVRVLNSSISIAGPICADMMADWGADVIWVENSKSPDISRGGTGTTVDQDRRNMRNISMDVLSPEGKEAFTRLLANSDIFIEASKPGQYDKWGFSDETLWEINPSLVIVHISGFGQTCDPEYYGRASYDPIAQAYGGMMYINSLPSDDALAAVMPTVADYLTGHIACAAALASYSRVLRGGKGESIDMAQYEAVLRCCACWGPDEWNLGHRFDRANNHLGNAGTAGYRSYTCQDGNMVYILVLGPGVLKTTFEFLGLPYGTEEVPVGTFRVDESTLQGQMLDKALREYFGSHDADVAEKEMAALGIPIAQVLSYDQMIGHPLFESRNTIAEYEKVNGDKFLGVNVVPKFKTNPCRVWRGGPSVGCDNEDVLAEIGLSEEEIAAMYERKVIVKR